MLVIACTVLALGASAVVSNERAETYKRQMTNNNQRAFGELVTAMSEIDSALQKSLYATSPGMCAATCTEAFGKAMMAQMAIGVLPYSSQELEQIAGFVSRVGDYTYSIARNAVNGSVYTQEERENLRALSQTASMLSGNLRELQAEMSDGRLTMDELTKAEERMDQVEESLPETLGDGIRLIEQEFPEIPTLVYDGPFSSHLEEGSPKLLEGAAEVDENTAMEAVAEFLGIQSGAITPQGKVESEVPRWSFGAVTETGEVSVSVSVAGGVVMSVLGAHPEGEATLGAEEAVDKALEVLGGGGYENMKETYYVIDGNVAVINFAYMQGDVICYPDLINVSIALDSGALVGFEAHGYINAHCQRELATPAVTIEEARGCVTDDLKILSEGLALIPTGGKYEVLCYEFKCETESGQHYLIYVDVESGDQEKILILLEDETGALTI